MKFKTEIKENEVVISSYVAWDIISRATDSDGYIHITSEDQLTFSNYGNLGNYCAMDGAEYYREAGYSEAEIVERLQVDAQCWDSQRYQIMNLGSAITADKQPRELLLSLKFGDKVKFCGKKFIVKAAANHNAKLEEIF